LSNLCRMLIMVDNGELLSLRSLLLASLVEASRGDPYLYELYGKYSHSDGWGARSTGCWKWHEVSDS